VQSCGEGSNLIGLYFHRRGNDFFGWGAKIGENNQDNQIESITMQYVLFDKGTRKGKAPATGEFSRIFVLKVTLQAVKITFNCKLQKELGKKDALVGVVAPPIIFLPGSPIHQRLDSCTYCTMLYCTVSYSSITCIVYCVYCRHVLDILACHSCVN